MEKNWIENLQEVLAEEAYRQFASRVLSLEEFKAYLEKITSVPDWEKEFTDACYAMYIDKINMAGDKLSDKIHQN